MPHSNHTFVVDCSQFSNKQAGSTKKACCRGCLIIIVTVAQNLQDSYRILFFFLLNTEFVIQYSKLSGPILTLNECQIHMLAKCKCENCFTCEFEPRCAKHIEKNEICTYFGTRIPNPNGYFTIRL